SSSPSSAGRRAHGPLHGGLRPILAALPRRAHGLARPAPKHAPVEPRPARAPRRRTRSALRSRNASLPRSPGVPVLPRTRQDRPRTLWPGGPPGADALPRRAPRQPRAPPRRLELDARPVRVVAGARTDPAGDPGGGGASALRPHARPVLAFGLERRP